MKFFRSYGLGMTTMILEGPLGEVELRLISHFDKRARRAIARSFFRQIRPWLELFRDGTIDHSDTGESGAARLKKRGIPDFQSTAITSDAGRFGFEIRICRLKIGLTQNELARLAGIRRTHLSDIERGLHVPRSHTRHRILVALKEANVG